MAVIPELPTHAFHTQIYDLPKNILEDVVSAGYLTYSQSMFLSYSFRSKSRRVYHMSARTLELTAEPQDCKDEAIRSVILEDNPEKSRWILLRVETTTSCGSIGTLEISMDDPRMEERFTEEPPENIWHVEEMVVCKYCGAAANKNQTTCKQCSGSLGPWRGPWLRKKLEQVKRAPRRACPK